MHKANMPHKAVRSTEFMPTCQVCGRMTYVKGKKRLHFEKGLNRG